MKYLRNILSRIDEFFQNLRSERVREWGLPLGLAILGSGFLYYHVSSYRSQLEMRIPQKLVAIAARSVEMGEVISKDDLALVEMPEKYLPMGTVLESDRSSILGLEVTYPIARGELLLWSKLDADYFATGPAGHITPGYRSISVRVTGVSSVAQAIRPGDHVDLICTLKPEGAENDKTFVLLQNITVLDVGDARRLSDGSSYSTVSLMILPKEVNLITHAQRLGSISFVLRNPKDDQILKDLPIVANHQVMESGFRNSLQEERNQGVEIIKGGLGNITSSYR